MNLTVVEGIGLRWFCVILAVLLWHIAVVLMAKRRTTARTEGFFRGVLVLADAALVFVTLFGIAFLFVWFLVRPGAADF
jgi:hypothetical protein